MLIYLADRPKSHSSEVVPAELTVLCPPPPRCVHVGDTDARCEAFSRSEEQ